ncbi:hypothetical protein UFOVP133_52 [uncultured Caudovirales phage]|uniref:Uncharacterized protein n=1 Tax=uncultured Caudovirales phage TaxID=2100421 RepID=A0A6J5LCJ5_9CAUD|nr:hypothetical protein UFOVP133_52 [uncultured Caudovirales phage]
MAYLMSDMAAGGQAALQLQQTMAAAPNVQQVEANKMQAQGLAIQQEQANLEKTKLANLVADTGFKASKESKEKLQQLAGTFEFKTADDAQKLRLSAAVQFQNGDVENGVKTLTAAELYDTRQVAIKQKELDQNAQLVGNAYGVISALPDDKVQEFVDRMPTENKKALVSQIGEENWNKMSGGEKKEAAKNLMLNAKGQMAKQLKDIEVEKQKIIQESRERIERIRQDGAMARKLTGGTDRDMRDWNLYTKAQEHIESSGKKVLEGLDKRVTDAQDALDKTTFFKGAETKTLESAIKARDTFKRGQIQKELNLATSAPDFPGKSIVIDNLKRELELYGEEEKVTPINVKDKPEPKPATKPTPAPTAKPVATSNKDSGTKAAPMAMPKSAAEAVDGKYYNTKSGVLKWDAKTKTFVE